MKRIIIVPVILMTTVIFAQSFQPGIKAGVNISNFTGGDFNTVEHKALIGFHGGGLLRFKFNNFVVQPEVLFSTQGAKIKDSTFEANYKINYVNIPVMLQYESDGGFYVEAGPQIGFKVSENIPNSSVENFAKSTDLSIALGLGYISKIGLGIGGRYNVGVSKVGDFDASDISPNFKNGVIQISLFWVFFHGKKAG
jgi:Outer membrane protein beta-barrel domain